MHYAEKKRITLNRNNAQEFAYWVSSLVNLSISQKIEPGPDKLDYELLLYHALTIRDKVIIAAYKTNVANKTKTTLSLTKGEVYALAKLFSLKPLGPLMQTVKYQVTKGI